MTVPYIRKPTRNFNGRYSKSEYHLEPDHAAFERIGRRTKGGGGGGYLYGSSASSTHGSEECNGKCGLIPIFFFVVLAAAICVFCMAKRQARHNVHEHGRQAEESGAPERSIEVVADLESGRPTRHAQMLSRFYFQPVLPDKSNVNPESLENEKEEETTNTDDDDSIIQSNEPEGSKRYVSFLSSVRISGFIGRGAVSNQECSVCLHGYEPGQTICMTKHSKHCKHIFHKDCLEEWLKEHDNCPLCRAKLMES